LTDRGTRLTRPGTKRNATLAEVSLLLAALFVGTDVVSVKYALVGFPPLVLMPMRYVVAGLLLLAAIGLLGRQGAVALGDLPALAGLGLVGIAINQVGYTVGLSLTSGSNASLVFATAPVWGLLLGVYLARRAWRPGSAVRTSNARDTEAYRNISLSGGMSRSWPLPAPGP
jgi:drug/metabolite transporter (DMT)-like permease